MAAQLFQIGTWQMAKGISPTQRTKAVLKKQGVPHQITEHWNQWARKRIDLFGFIDIVALTEEGIVGIQTTSSSNHSARKAKILAEPRAKAWLEAGGIISIWTWGRKGARGKRKLWSSHEECITLEDFK
jgi:hypothetical protein